jgi:hypothetical protein
MSVKKLISIKNAVLNAQDMLGMDNDAMRPLFTTWATYAEKEIGGACSMTKFALLDICGCVAELPDDTFQVEGAILGNHEANCGAIFSGELIGNTISRPAGNQFIVVDVGNDINGSSFCGTVPYEIQDNKLVFEQCLTATQITIKYKGLATDCEGFIKIGENHVLAISEYIQYMYWKRKRNKDNSEERSMNLAMREWDRLCAHARADDAILTETEREEIAQLYNDPYAGRGLSAGMRFNGLNGGYDTVGY